MFFSIPDLSFGPSDSLPTPNSSVDVPEDLNEPEHDGAVDDIWFSLEDEPVETANFQSWDSFNEKAYAAPFTPYITEAGPQVFDAAVSAQEDQLRTGNINHAVVDTTEYTASVLALGLGRSSVLFAWDEDKKSFKPTLPRMRISGYTGDTLDGLLFIFQECGNITKSLQDFVESTYARYKSPGQIALADAVSTLLTTIQARLHASASPRNSLLQLQNLFQPVHSLLTCFRRIVTNIATTRNDEAMLSTVFEEIQMLEHRTDSLKSILLEILSRVSIPWLEFSGEWLGLQREAGLPLTKDGQGKSFVKVQNRKWIDDQGLEIQQADYELDYDKIPSFMTPEDARAMFEVGRSLRFLRIHHTDHPLSRADIVASAGPPPLAWKFSWQGIAQVEARAVQYEKDLIAAIQEFSQDGLRPTIRKAADGLDQADFELDLFGKPEEEMEAQVLASIDKFDMALDDRPGHDRLSDMLDAYLASDSKFYDAYDSLFEPPISLTPLLSFNPVVSAQARLVNRTCMRMLFNSHNLREHLSVQRNFQLLGNGLFSSRLSHAIFDPEMESAERHKGVARSGGTMGLRLGGRDTWPPASSELRLALMGVLSESYVPSWQGDKSQNGNHFGSQSSLPGDLSFAVRDMSAEEIERCMNSDSIEALDFLRLSYKPPAPLDAVITPMILFKYDQLFKLLLRVIRMLYVVSALFRDAPDRNSAWEGIDLIAQRFRIEARHFVSSLSEYFFGTGVEATWRIFEHKLDQVEERINSDSDDTAFGQNDGLDKLRDYHERMLDRVMFALLLRKRQQPVMKLLEEIFTLILQFAKHSREKALGLEQNGAGGKIREMYRKYRQKVGVFIMVCRGLSEKKGYGKMRTVDARTSEQGGLFDGNDLAEENTISQLLARLELTDYYSQPVNV